MRRDEPLQDPFIAVWTFAPADWLPTTRVTDSEWGVPERRVGGGSDAGAFAVRKLPRSGTSEMPSVAKQLPTDSALPRSQAPQADSGHSC